MPAVRGKSTGPEWTVRRLLHFLGYRHRLNRRDLPGKPDLVFASRRKVIFVHGCFWHAHGCRYGRPPKSRLDCWLPKLERNKQRDTEARTQLEALRWQVLTVWGVRTQRPRLAYPEAAVLPRRKWCESVRIRGGNRLLWSKHPRMDSRRRMESRRPIGIDLFAGAGGLSLGFESAGFDIAAAVDVDPIHCATHEFNFPRCTTVCRSVLDLSGADVRHLAGIGASDVDVVFGGAPCQGFSLIGKRALDDSRNALVYHFVRLVLELQPSYFAFENVKGLTVGRARQVLDEMVEAFEQGGYRVRLPYRVINAADFRVPQNRHRLFLLGARGDRPLPSYPERREERVTVAEAIGDLPEADEFPELIERDWVEAGFRSPSAYARILRALAVDPEDFGYRRKFDRSVLTASLRTAHTAKSRRRFAATAAGKTEPVSRFLKLDPVGLCNTIRSGTASDRGAFTSPRPIHPEAPRCITNREAARLHSYPDWFRFHVTKWHGFRQVGNSVPPLLARAVAVPIITALGVSPSVPADQVDLGDPALLSITMAQAAKRYGVPYDAIPKRRRGATADRAAEERRMAA